jgi:hypothetical protein
MKTIPRYIGRLNFAPRDWMYPDLWQLEEPLAQVTSDGHIIICRPWQRTDGASIPRCLWGRLGHPFEGSNAWWSQPHDQGYNATSLVLRLSDVWVIGPETLLYSNTRGGYNYDSYRLLHVDKPRRWYDWAMREAMTLGGDPAPAWKRSLAWAGVRIGGGMAWREGHSGKS